MHATAPTDYSAAIPAPAYWTGERRAESAEQAAARDAELREAQKLIELKTQFMAMLNGTQPFISEACVGTSTASIEKNHNIWQATHDALDFERCAGLLMVVLRESTCPLVHELKTLMATAYAESQYVEQVQIEMGVV